MSKRPRIPGYLRHKATGQARVILNGRTYYLGLYDSKPSRERYARSSSVSPGGRDRRHGESYQVLLDGKRDQHRYFAAALLILPTDLASAF